MARETIELEVEELLFDPENPRLPPGVGSSQKRIYRYLVDSIGVDDLLQAISSGGFVQADPMIARPHQERPGAHHVIEGNRRLAAVKLLIGEKINDGDPEPSVPDISEEQRAKLSHLLVEIGWPLLSWRLTSATNMSLLPRNGHRKRRRAS